MTREILLASKTGFCLGVDLALKKLDLALTQSKKLATLGPIIHNPQVLDKYAQKGVKIISSPQEITDEDTVLIRAHGLPAYLEAELKNKNINIVDATCPKVKKAQILIAKNTQTNPLLLYGEKKHPEVKGLISYAQNEVLLFESLEELKSLTLNTSLTYTLASQTTQDQHKFEEIQSYLKNKKIQFKTLNTICNATEERQQEALKIAKEVELMIVIGGKMSGNTRRLAKLVSQVTSHIHIETKEELLEQEIKKYKKIGITAGASTPKEIIEEVIDKLKSIS